MTNMLFRQRFQALAVCCVLAAWCGQHTQLVLAQGQPMGRQSHSQKVSTPAVPAVTPESVGEPATQGADDPEKMFETLPEVDEQLFLIRRADSALGQAFAVTPGAAESSEILAKIRRQLVGDHEYAVGHGMLPELIDVLKLSLESLDAFTQYLMDVDLLEKDFLQNEADRQAQATVEGLVEGGQIGSGLAIASVEPMTALVVIGGQMVKKTMEESQKQESAKVAKAASLEKRFRQYEEQSSRLQARMRVTAHKAAEKIGCEPEEAGFDMTDEEVSRLQTALQGDDIAVFFAMLDAMAEARPRDPFVIIGKAAILLQAVTARIEANRPLEEFEDLAASAVGHFVYASRLIPDKRPFHELRADCLLCAAVCVTLLVSVEEVVETEKTLELCEPGLLCLNKAAELNPRGRIAEAGMARAYLLARAGQREAALEVMADVGQRAGQKALADAGWTEVLSLAGETDLAWKRLQAELVSGDREVRAFLRDPAFSAVRDRYRNELATLTKAAWTWDVEYGLAWNELHVTNDSQLRIACAVVKAAWKSKDGKRMDACYWLPELLPGQAQTFQGVFDGATNDAVNQVRCEASLACDTTRRVSFLSEQEACGRYHGLSTYSSVDGSDVRESATAVLLVKETPDAGLAITLDTDGVTVSFECSALDDGLALFDSQGQKAFMAFDDDKIFGYVQTKNDSAAGFLRAFWVTKKR